MYSFSLGISIAAWSLGRSLVFEVAHAEVGPLLLVVSFARECYEDILFSTSVEEELAKMRDSDVLLGVFFCASLRLVGLSVKAVALPC